MRHAKAILFSLIFVMGLSTSLLALNPSRTYKQRPEKYGMKYEEVKVPTEDGATLNAWYFPANRTTTNLIIISHDGNGNMADYLRRVDQFTSIGYNVFIYDFRGYGASSDFEIDNNMFIYPQFQDDVKAVIDYCRKQYVSTFYMYGFGHLGAGLSMGIGYNRREIKGIIADTPFLSMEDTEERIEGSEELEGMEVPFAGYDKKHEPLYALDNPPRNERHRVKLIIGSNDVLFRPTDMETLQKKQKKLVEKDIYVVENPDRKDNFRIDKAAYFNEIKEFLGVK